MSQRTKQQQSVHIQRININNNNDEHNSNLHCLFLSGCPIANKTHTEQTIFGNKIYKGLRNKCTLTIVVSYRIYTIVIHCLTICGG